ncbi:hypothetical protein EBR04_05385 [bacterium]|nr:hypothetical protein [bacterium]
MIRSTTRQRSRDSRVGSTIRPCLFSCLAVLLAGSFNAPCAAIDPAADPVATVVSLLGSDDAELRSIGLERVRAGLRGQQATAAVAVLVAKAPAPRQIELVRALADRGDQAALPAVLALLPASQEPDVRVAAILAIGRLGGPTEVAVLRASLAGRDPERAAARQALEQLRGADVGKQLAEAALVGEPASKPTIIEILTARRERGAAADLLGLASDPDAAVRLAALKAVAKLGGTDQIDGVVDALLKAPAGGERDEAERTIVSLCTESRDGVRVRDAFLARFKAAGEVDQETLLPALGRIGGPEALAVVDGLLAEGGKRTLGLKAITRWPDGTVCERLIDLVGKAGSQDERKMLVDALIRIAPLPDNKRDDKKRLEMVQKTFTVCDADEQRGRLIERANAIRTIEAFRFVLPYVDDPKFAEPACKSVVELAHHQNLRDAHKDEFVKALDKVIATTKNPELVERAGLYKQGKTWERKKSS